MDQRVAKLKTVAERPSRVRIISARKAIRYEQSIYSQG
jgi:uncharacterized DUF497 family protein